jgi:tetratricopeptide (TPR) repeat protein
MSTPKDAALKLMGKEAWREAFSILEALSREAEADFETQWSAGWCQFRLSNFQAAEPFFNSAVALEPENPTGHYSLAATLFELDQLERSEVEYLKALSLRDGSLARSGLALLYLSQGRVEEAENVHLEGLAMQPESARRLESYGDFLVDVGRTIEAEDAYRRARGTRPDHDGRVV